MRVTTRAIALNGSFFPLMLMMSCLTLFATAGRARSSPSAFLNREPPIHAVLAASAWQR